MISRSDLRLSARSLTLRKSLMHDLGDTECWPWQGFVDYAGYGRAYEPGTKKLVRAHRLVWTLMVGALREGEVLDHMCHEPAECKLAANCPHRACVNPNHLRVTDAAGNNERSNSPVTLNGLKTHCKHGHAFTERNTIHRRGGGRTCRACQTERNRGYTVARGGKPRLARRTVTDEELEKDA